MSWRERACLMVCALVLLSLLITAGFVRPDPSGLGTHRQLGFPPCTIWSLYNVRCPACGMTTSWAYFVRGRWIRALEANSGGTLLALAAALAVPWLIGSAMRAKWFPARPSEWSVLLFGVVFILITAAQWLVRIVPGIWR